MEKQPGQIATGTLRAIAVLSGLVITLVGAVAFLIFERGNVDPRELVALALQRDEIKNAAIERLVADGRGVWDSFSDPQVGRLMLRNIKGRKLSSMTVDSNEYGMREASYTAEKPAGTTRVVVLGDSYVYGYNVEADDRLGVFLRGYLAERGNSTQIECLHLGITSWNVLAETSYLRRQLHILRPDLVVHVVVSNDLNDCKGVRGFGEMASYSPQVRERVGGLIGELSPAGIWPRRLENYLKFGLDHESRARYGQAADEISGLAKAVEAQGGKYLMLSAWEDFNPRVEKFIASKLDRRQVGYVSKSFTKDLKYRIDETDRHWNRAGHERIAMLIYGLTVQRDLLPGLGLRPWPEAEDVVREVHDRGSAEAALVDEHEAQLVERVSREARSEIDFTNMDGPAAKQFHGGAFGDGLLTPYASLLLARGDGDTLLMRGSRLDPSLLAGGTAIVSIEGIAVGQLALSGEPLAFEERWPLPTEVRGNRFLTLSIASDDYLYTNAENGSCAALKLELVRIE